MGRPLIGTIMMILAVVFLPVFLFSGLMGAGTTVWMWLGGAILLFGIGLYLRKHPHSK
ncbi:MAG: hypothetical protein JW846_06440 [Dehalococcoidia bacterium]|nr:hypothetical protein [Dehalococcoidia bacterium]